MERLEGYYWVKVMDGEPWTIGLHSEGKWMIITSLKLYDDSFFSEIGSLIQPPK